MKNNLFPALLLLSVSLFTPIVSAQISSGGVYRLEQTVVASGGGASTNGIYGLEGTSGQSAAGAFSTGGSYRLLGGFWTPLVLAPTAAGFSISGQVADVGGGGIKDALVILTGGLLTAPRAVRTNNFGRFVFSGVEAGHLYVIAVEHKKYGFAQNSRTLVLFEDVSGVEFRADWEN